MEVQEFPGKTTKENGYNVFGEIEGTFKASVGLDSVFSANEINSQ